MLPGFPPFYSQSSFILGAAEYVYFFIEYLLYTYRQLFKIICTIILMTRYNHVYALLCLYIHICVKASHMNQNLYNFLEYQNQTRLRDFLLHWLRFKMGPQEQGTGGRGRGPISQLYYVTYNICLCRGCTRTTHAYVHNNAPPS